MMKSKLGTNPTLEKNKDLDKIYLIYPNFNLKHDQVFIKIITVKSYHLFRVYLVFIFDFKLSILV